MGSVDRKAIARTFYSQAQNENCFALLSSLHPRRDHGYLRLLNCTCACSTMLKERGKRLQLRFNIPNIPEYKRNVEWMLKQSLNAFKLFQHRFNIVSTRFNSVERGWQTLSTLPFNKIERMFEANVEAFAWALNTSRPFAHQINLHVCWPRD